MVKFLDPESAAEILGVTTEALRNWRNRGGGPPYVKLHSANGVIRYRQDLLIEWAMLISVDGS